MNILKCPNCNLELLSSFCDERSGLDFEKILTKPHKCSCGFLVTYSNSILDLIGDNKSTSLDIKDYILTHPQSHGKALYEYFYQPFFSKYNVNSSQIKNIGLELASGPGQLTSHIASLNLFDTLLSTDISNEFLQHQVQSFGSNNTSLCFARVDGDNIPFCDKTINVIYGNSVLHHFFNYRKTIQECYRILKPNGFAVFGEPILNGNLPIYLFLNVLNSLLRRVNINNTDPSVVDAIQESVKSSLNMLEMQRCRNPEIYKYEDKYQFSIPSLRNLAKESGFSDFVVLTDLVPDHAEHKPSCNHLLNIASQSINLTSSQKNNFDLSTYKWLADAIHEALVVPQWGEESIASFSIFAFIK